MITLQTPKEENQSYRLARKSHNRLCFSQKCWGKRCLYLNQLLTPILNPSFME